MRIKDLGEPFILGCLEFLQDNLHRQKQLQEQQSQPVTQNDTEFSLSSLYLCVCIGFIV